MQVGYIIPISFIFLYLWFHPDTVIGVLVAIKTISLC